MRGRRRESGNFWPSFVDVAISLFFILMVVIIIMIVKREKEIDYVKKFHMGVETSVSNINKTRIKSDENKSSGIKTSRDGFDIMMTFGADILFDKDKKVLKPEGRRILETVINEILLPSYKNRVKEVMPDIQVVGHTDSGTSVNEKIYGNWELSTDRAISVVKLMIEKGLHPQEDCKTLLSAKGYSQYMSVTNDRGPGRGIIDELAALNRRIEIILHFEQHKIKKHYESATNG